MASAMPVLQVNHFGGHSKTRYKKLFTYVESHFIVQELCESRGGRPGLSVLTSLLVSVDVKKLLNRASALVTTCP